MMSDIIVQENLNRKLAEMLGYVVKQEGGLWKTYLNGEIISDSLMAGWPLEESAWSMDVPDWWNDLNAAIQLLDVNSVIQISWLEDGSPHYYVAIGWRMSHYADSDLAHAICHARVQWQEAKKLETK